MATALTLMPGSAPSTAEGSTDPHSGPFKLTDRDRNVLHEATMKADGVERHRKRQLAARAQSREGTVHPYNGLMAAMVAKAEQLLATRIGRRKGNIARGNLAVRDTKLGVETVCAIAARTVIDGISKGHRIQTVSVSIGTRIEDEVRMREFKRREPELYKWMQAKFTERGTRDYRHMRNVLMGALRRANSEEQWQVWEAKTKAEVGLLMLDVFVEAGFVEKVYKPADKRKQALLVKLTADAEAALHSADERALEFLKPWFKPMLETPVDWTDPEDGGYLTIDLPIMKTRRRQDIERLRYADMPVVYGAVNAIQRTPWRINEDVLATAEELRAMGLAVPGLPNANEYDQPTRPALPPIGSELTEEQKETLAQYKAARRAWFDNEAVRRSKAVQALQILAIADELRHEESIYFPHQLDYRSRAYAVPIQLSPQGNDLSKGLLRFARGYPVGEMGGYWLAVHVANTWGVDKGALNDRVDWTIDNTDWIVEVASDPVTNRRWLEADGGKKPWQFLAACIEWAAYIESGEAPDFESHLPVSVDGSCNGLQHFAAMMRDPIAARAVNLTADPVQHDIYTEVAQATNDLIRAKRHLSEQDRVIGGIWLEHGVGRKEVKRPVMTTPYGATQVGMKEMVLTDTMRGVSSDVSWGDHPWMTAKWLADTIYEAIGTTVAAAQVAMGYLQTLARIAAEHEQPIAWTSPAGFPVLQRINRTSTFSIDTQLLGRIQLKYVESKDQLDLRKQVASIAPNFVHSHDAAHMMRTVVDFERHVGGEVSWAMVHDSFGTHAGRVDELGKILRAAFVAMYLERNPLDELRERVVDSVPTGTEVPPVPPVGSFDIVEVLKAEFFFA